MKTIYNYTDYRTFLKEYLKMKQAKNSSFSLGAWAKRLQMSSTAVLSNIIKGRKNLGKKSLERFNKYFDFDKSEEEYFKNLVNLYKVKNDPVLSLATQERLRQMQKLHLNNVLRFLSDEEYSVISNWYYSAIRAMTDLSYFKEDYEWIASMLHFNVTPEEVEQALTHLLDLGLVTRNEEGRLQASDDFVFGSEKASPELARRYQSQILENGKNAIEEVPQDERLLMGATMNIDREKLPQMKQIVHEFWQKYTDLFSDKSGNQTYQMTIQLYPLSRKKE